MCIILSDREGLWLLEPFSNTPVGKLLVDVDSVKTESLLLAYVTDFVHMAHPCATDIEHWVSSYKFSQLIAPCQIV